MKKHKTLIGAGIVILLAVACGRLAALKAASDYGRHVAAAFSALGYEGLADTRGLHEFFQDPHLMGCENRTRNLSFLGGKHNLRIRELKSGLAYLSEQTSVAAGQRFANPPPLQTLSLDTSDPSDRGLGKAAGELILEFRDGP